jgi:hypothetical protein
MNNKYCNEYWFDFNGSVNEQLPLSYEVLKLCRKEINKIELSGKNNNSPENAIKLTFNLTNDSISATEEINSELYELNSSTIVNNFSYNIGTYINSLIQPVILFLEFKLKFSSIKLNIKHYYVINNKLYVTYKDSFLKFDSLNEYLSDLSKINNVKSNFLYRNNILNIFGDLNLNTLIDSMFLKLLLNIHLLYLNITNFSRFDFRLKQTYWGFYLNTNTNNLNSIFSGLKYIWRGLRFWLVGLLLGLSSIYYLMYVRLLPFNKILFAWILVAMFLYWLLSGFVFFVKKYQYSKFTAAIQRFWKRTYILFWLIEVGTFSVFFYLTLNASSEPVYMYDQIKIYKTHLFSWRWFLIKLLPSVAVILLGYYLQLTLKWNLFNKQNTIILTITLLLLYILWLEFYQFFHIISFFANITWSFDYDEYIWTLEMDSRRTRLANNYISVCLLLKFWHFVFIFLFWVFFVLRINELGRVRYPLLVANVQNFIIIYMMSWAYMYPWLKFIVRKYLDVPYYWFYLNGRELGIRVFFTDLKLFFYGLIDRLLDFNLNLNRFERYPFFYWINTSVLTGFDQYRKFVIRDSIIYTFNSYII